MHRPIRANSCIIHNVLKRPTSKWWTRLATGTTLARSSIGNLLHILHLHHTPSRPRRNISIRNHPRPLFDYLRSIPPQLPWTRTSSVTAAATPVCCRTPSGPRSLHQSNRVTLSRKGFFHNYDWQKSARRAVGRRLENTLRKLIGKSYENNAGCFINDPLNKSKVS